MEGLFQGVKLAVEEGWFPVIVEGESNIIIQMEKKLANGKSIEKNSSSWRLLGQLDSLRTLISSHNMVSFIHVR